MYFLFCGYFEDFGMKAYKGSFATLDEAQKVGIYTYKDTGHYYEFAEIATVKDNMLVVVSKLDYTFKDAPRSEQHYEELHSIGGTVVQWGTARREYTYFWKDVTEGNE